MDWKIYNDAKTAITHVIENKEKEICDIEAEIRELKHTRRMMDEEFKKQVKKTPSYLG